MSEPSGTGGAGEGIRKEDDLELIEEAPEDLPPDDSPEATAEAKLTELEIDEETSSEVELEDDRSGRAK